MAALVGARLGLAYAHGITRIPVSADSAPLMINRSGIILRKKQPFLDWLSHPPGTLLMRVLHAVCCDELEAPWCAAARAG